MQPRSRVDLLLLVLLAIFQVTNRGLNRCNKTSGLLYRHHLLTILHHRLAHEYCRAAPRVTAWH
jgi:hypothetical protein